MAHVIPLQLGDPEHELALLRLLDEYASDPLGGGEPLAKTTRERLVPALREQPAYYGFLALADGVAVGLANCFRGFSTFRAAPLLNLHDIAVSATHRGRGVAAALLAAVEQKARELGCCKVTLEVLSNNLIAQRAYLRAGFGPYELGAAENGSAQFWQKELEAALG